MKEGKKKEQGPFCVMVVKQLPYVEFEKGSVVFSFLFSFRFIHFAIMCDRAMKSGVKLDWKARKKEERTRSFRVIAVKQLPDVEFGKGSVVFFVFFQILK